MARGMSKYERAHRDRRAVARGGAKQAPPPTATPTEAEMEALTAPGSKPVATPKPPAPPKK